MSSVAHRLQAIQARLAVLLLTAAVFVVFSLFSPAAAAERVALIIGNSSYNKATELKNPRNDAEAIAKVLQQFDFRVIKGIDVDLFNFRTLVRAFTREIKDAKLALFYYAGHGLQVGQNNYLLPTDAELKEEADLDFETVRLNFVLQQMERRRTTNIILLDACRDNPFAANLSRNMGTRSSTVGKGLAPVETGVGTFVGFATQPGNVALDGVARHSPFTTALLKHLDEPGLDIGVLMRRVREEVISSTEGKQVPWSNSSLVGDSVVLNRNARQIVVEPRTPAKPANDNTANVALELSYWNTVKDSNNPALLQTYIAQYPNGTFAGLAKAMIESMQGKQKPKQQLVYAAPDVAQPDTKPKPSRDKFALSHDLQGELRRLGCISSRPDGIWGPKSRAALRQFGRHAGLKLTSLEPSEGLIDELKKRSSRVCPIVCGAQYKLKGGRCVKKTCARNQVLTKKGRCITRKATAKKAPTQKRRTRKRREVVEEEIIEPAPRKRKRREKKNMFDNEDDLCPQCNTL